MSIPTVAVTCTAYDQNGNAVAGGTFRARLNSTEIYNGFVVPEQVTGVADASGVCVLQLWPNALGVAGSAYRITAINPDTGQKYLDTTAVVPNSACNLHQIIVAAPYPTVDASQQALVAAQGALAAVTAQAGIATTKAAEASASATTAATQAGIATTQAGTATTQAGIATTQATTATTQADIAAVQAGIATTKASEASASAATATTQAGIAITKASEAAASAATATTQAGTATTQAGVATTKASEAAASATNANNSAYTAGLSVDAAVTARNQAVSSASAAASSATAASGSATAASTSASSASASASTATTQAGTATTQAGLATTAATTATSKASEASTYASNASASANTATTQAGVATTQAGIATTQAGVATTQAGIAIANANAALSVYGSVTAQQAAVTAAQNAATSATASAAAANTSAGSAAGSAASALAIYGTTAAQQAALTNAQSAASLAQGYALSASSAVQQDLSGATAQALHRSPNAVTAMFVYDTSKDSDGGAWTEKCQHTSWYNEALNGKWLGAQESETQARYVGATVGNNIVTTTFPLTVSTGTSVGVITAPTVGKWYELTYTITARSGTMNLFASAQAGPWPYRDFASTVGTHRYAVYAEDTATAVLYTSLTGSITFSSISVREVTALTTASGDYYQSTVDGKFYRLWKNLLIDGHRPTAVWSSNRMTAGSSSLVTLKDGTTVSLTKAIPTAVTGTHGYSRDLGLSIVAGIPFRVSGVARSNGYNYLTLGVNVGNSSIAEVIVDLSAGTVVAGLVQPSVTNVTVGIESHGNGVYRFTLTGTATVGGGTIYFTPSDVGRGNTLNVSWAANGVDGVDVGGFSIEWGIAATSLEIKADGVGTTTETFRGNKADFPRLAGIVAEAASVTIYDLTEAGRPMWMRFATNGSWNYINGVSLSGLAAVNGLLSVTHTGNGGCLSLLSFATDTVRYFRQAHNYNAAPRAINIASRQFTTSPNAVSEVPPTLNNAVGNAVAMTVLPDAPVDAVTGLQVPTIALATEGGPSVIRHDGTVTNPYGGSLRAVNVDFGSRGDLIFHIGENYQSYRVSYPPYTSYTGYNIVPARPAEFGKVNKVSKNRVVAIKHPTAASGFFLYRDNGSAVRSSAAHITNTFNTGHMLSDIRRAYLADVDVGSVGPAPNLVTNGTFDTDTAGWTALNSATIAVVDGKLRITSQASNYGAAQTGIATVVGKTYTLVLDISGTFNTSVQVSGSTVLASAIRSGTFGVSFVATAVTTGITLLANSGVGTYADFDNISVQEVVADRSYKAARSSITGTLTKTQVAAASQLVAYSGFSAANYLREPYSADLDFGTGEWSCSAWVNVPVTLPVGSFPVVGSNLVVNGSFDTDTVWGKGTGWTIGGGVATHTGAAGYISQGVLTAGKMYSVTVDVTAIGVGGFIQFPSAFYSKTVTLSTVGTHTFNIGATSSTLWVYSQNDVSFDNISVVEVGSSLIADRSFSSGSKLNLGVDAFGYLTATAFDGTNPARTVTTTAAYNTATWIKPEAVYTTDGTLAIRVNGVEVAAIRGAPLLTLNNSNAVLTIGNSFAANAPFPGSIALLKLSATVPTAEQSQWMYEQEKQMFRDGAQVTLPDAGSIVDLAYDDATDKWLAVSATNESEWSGLVRTSITPSPAGSYSKISAASGIQLQARTTTNPGVDVTIPSYGLREELVNRSQAAARLARNMVVFDYVGGFTANTTTGSTAIASVASLTYPVSYVGARISGAGIPANTTVVAVSGTTIYMSAAATATASAVQISFVDFNLPVGYEAREVLTAGLAKVEGSTKDFTRLFDGFKETIRFGTAPGYNAAVQIQATRSAS